MIPLPTVVATEGIRPYAAQRGRREEPRPRPVVIVSMAMAIVAATAVNIAYIRRSAIAVDATAAEVLPLPRRPSPLLQCQPLQSPLCGLHLANPRSTTSPSCCPMLPPSRGEREYTVASVVTALPFAPRLSYRRHPCSLSFTKVRYCSTVATCVCRCLRVLVAVTNLRHGRGRWRLRESLQLR